jgi:hypothetical protein
MEKKKKKLKNILENILNNINKFVFNNNNINIQEQDQQKLLQKIRNKIENFQFINSEITKIFKIIFYNGFLILTIILEFEYILILGGKNIVDYLNNLISYINEIDLKFNKEL